MKTMYDVQRLLKRFGIFIYTGNRFSDLEIMKDEIIELYEKKLIDIRQYQQAILVLKKEIREKGV